MQGSRYVTTQVMEMLVRLNALTHQDADSRMQPMIQKGFEYLGKQAAEEYKSMKEAEKKGAVGSVCQSRFSGICISALWMARLRLIKR